MENNKKIWVNVEDKSNDPQFLKSSELEFFELPITEGLADEKGLKESKGSRRDFLKFLGFGLGAATIASSCDIPVRKAIPYVVKPDAIVPGIANYYASSIVDGGDYCSVLVKTREGRPIKIEGNHLSQVTKGGTSARTQAAVLSLYDNNRTKNAGSVADGKVTAMDWAKFDETIKGKLNTASSIKIVSNTLMSPSISAAIEAFKLKYPNTQHVQYDPVSVSGLLDANQASFGTRVVPSYRFDQAMCIVSFGADFLGTWISPVEYAQGYVQNRKVENANSKISKHYQFEAGMSMTGSNADERIAIKPSEQSAAVAALLSALGGGGSVPSGLNAKAKAAITKVAADLKKFAGRSIVVSGSNDVNEQILVNAINSQLGNYGATIDLANYSNQRKGDDKAIQALSKGMRGAAVIIMGGANPVYDLPNGAQFGEALKSASVSISMNQKLDETSALCQYVAPDHHNLETWGDVAPKINRYSIIQPTIAPLFKTRAAGATLLSLAGSDKYDATLGQPWMEFVKKNWEDTMFGQQQKFARFQSFWDNALHDGVFEVPLRRAATGGFNGNVAAAAGAIQKPVGGESIEVSFVETVAIGDGRYADNPWLQEMPDPVTRTVWDNVLAIPVKYDEASNSYQGFNDLQDGDLVNLEVNGQTYQLSVIRQFGQMPGTATVALGYGRAAAGPTGTNVGTNLYPALKSKGGTTQYFATGANISRKVGKDEHFACVQMHHTYGLNTRGDDGKIKMDKGTGRPYNVDEAEVAPAGYQGSITERSVVYYSNIKDLQKNIDWLKERRAHAEHLNQETLYPYEEYSKNYYEQGHHWGMSVDMNACIGCGACSIACMAENNIPVVGKEEVQRVHEMSWIRIDRYYYGDEDSPNVIYQPMMCQHCDNAPCENVCPVAATNHSSEGLNQMTYNRCIGTRYCANNCPYKVRRFNWLDYNATDLFPYNESNLNSDDKTKEEYVYMQDNLMRMVLNPDVTVRTRGVIEKCSFCVQRLQEGKLRAKNEGRQLRDGDVKVACQSACPTGAIVFGDTNDKKSKIAKELKSDLNYFVLEEVNTRSSVGYKMKVVNRDDLVGSAPQYFKKKKHDAHGHGNDHSGKGGHGNENHGSTGSDHGKGHDANSHEGHDHSGGAGNGSAGHGKGSAGHSSGGSTEHSSGSGHGSGSGTIKGDGDASGIIDKAEGAVKGAGGEVKKTGGKIKEVIKDAGGTVKDAGGKIKDAAGKIKPKLGKKKQ